MPVDALVLGFVAGGAMILAIVALQSASRGRALDTIADLLDGVAGNDPDADRAGEAAGRWTA